MTGDGSAVTGGRPLVEVGSDLGALDPAQWDALQRPGGWYASTPWLRHAHATADPAPWYLTASAGGRLLAALPAYPLDAGSPYVFCRTDEVVDELHRHRTGRPADWVGRLMPTLACGGRHPAHTRIGRRDGVPPGPVLDALLSAAENRAAEAGLRSVAFLHVDGDDRPLRTALDGRGYVGLPTEPAYVLDLPAGDAFAGYLAERRHGRRAAIRREQRALAEAGVGYQLGPLTLDLADLVAPLELALYARHGTPADPAAFRAVLRSIATHCAGRAWLLTAHRADAIVGFLLAFLDGAEVYARQTGFDTTLTGRLPVYFGLVYYELIRVAGLWGARRIYYSTGSGAVKSARGCRTVDQFAYVKSLDRAGATALADLVGRAPVPAGSGSGRQPDVRLPRAPDPTSGHDRSHAHRR